MLWFCDKCITIIDQKTALCSHQNNTCSLLGHGIANHLHLCNIKLLEVVALLLLRFSGKNMFDSKRHQNGQLLIFPSQTAAFTYPIKIGLMCRSFYFQLPPLDKFPVQPRSMLFPVSVVNHHWQQVHVWEKKIFIPETVLIRNVS